jgi:hypothetical protein
MTVCIKSNKKRLGLTINQPELTAAFHGFNLVVLEFYSMSGCLNFSFCRITYLVYWKNSGHRDSREQILTIVT